MPADPQPFSNMTNTSTESILAEAAHITSNSRRDAYGPPSLNHSRTATLWSAYLSLKLDAPVEVSARDVCFLNMLQKMSRDIHAPKRDNLVDIAGYAENADRIT